MTRSSTAATGTGGGPSWAANWLSSRAPATPSCDWLGRFSVRSWSSITSTWGSSGLTSSLHGWIMFVMPPTDTERLTDFDTGTLYEAAGEGAFAPGLHALSGEARVAGPALTVACPPGDNLAVHLAVAQAREGEVLVVQTHDWTRGVWGEVLTVAAMARGVRALVIDGSVRDL